MNLKQTKWVLNLYENKNYLLLIKFKKLLANLNGKNDDNGNYSKVENKHYTGHLVKKTLLNFIVNFTVYHKINYGKWISKSYSKSSIKFK